MNEEKIYYLAVDIGASSGRHILAHLENGKIVLEEMYRFPNGMDEENGHKVWDTERLFREIKTGMKKCCEAGKIPVSMAIDTWAVDYVLLDENDEKLGPCFAYRDSRTEGQDSEVYKVISEKELYDRTGIQKAIFNTIYQLNAVKEQHPEWLRKAGSFLMVPDYLNFLLTGVKKQEYTNASTTQLLDAVSCYWDRELIKKLGFPDKLFGELSMPGTVVGNLLPKVIEEVGFDCKVILPATHDTGSAVMSVPTVSEDVLYISSGTWSLLGTELLAPELSEEAHDANFTNEGGFDHRFRFLKNIMGLWMIQSVQKELIADYDLYIEKAYEASGPKMQDKRENAGESHNSGDILGETEEISIEDAKKYFSFANLCAKAKEASINSVVDANDSRFLAPKSMIEEVKKACRESGQQVPETPWEIARVIYHSLAVCYKKAVKEIEDITKKRYETIHIVGGGSNAEWLNELTAKETGLKVIAGPGEATAIGNIGAQMIASGVYEDLWMFRKAVSESFDVKCYES
ncbi:rhamnulokinase [Oribacterium sp. P6A1]|uniref:rhamnulokinase n=1 Tax=Oribacterium sp. P6A1 TaxID=1410612 RepID=UPI00055E3DBE|nr:rhamnulokinase family protein [Oribacterium sp. P6A1]